ncbi:helix-turn-helix domain-containing protein [Brachybacterium saurashtrense]|nr:AraC family transcriptional regulator [Brachybacterium saurashtrense]
MPFTAHVPPPLSDAMLAAFTRSLGVLSGGGVRAAAILALIRQGGPRIHPPSMPRSEALRRIAETLLADPSRPVQDVCTMHGVGESMLARGFRAETGWTPQRWRARHELSRAAERIVREGSVAAGAARTVYSSPQAFARAFRREWGIAPGHLLGRDAARSGAPVAPRPPASRTDAHAWPTPAATGALPEGGMGKPPGRRAATIDLQCSPYHVVLWVVGGSATLAVDGREMAVAADELACLPAGRDVSLRAGAESSVLPVGWLPGGIDMAGGAIARLGPEAREALIRLSAWTYAGVEPSGIDDPRRALQRALGLAEFAEVPAAVVDATYALLRRLARNPRDHRPVDVLAAEVEIDPAALRRAVEVLTGSPLPVWRTRLRMAWARRMLRDGARPSQVARGLGYADAAGFSRAFTRVHGRPPTAFRAVETSAVPP